MMALASGRAPSNSFCLEDVYDNEISPNGWFQSGQNVTYFSELPLFICILWQARYYLLESGQGGYAPCMRTMCGYGWWTFLPVHLSDQLLCVRARSAQIFTVFRITAYKMIFVRSNAHCPRNNVGVIKRNFVIGAGCECDLSFESFNCYGPLRNYTFETLIFMGHIYINFNWFF